MDEALNPSSPIYKLKRPWSENQNSIWLASTVKLQRNIEKFKFPIKLDLERKKQIVTLAAKELMAQEALKKSYLLKAEEMTSLEKEYLVEHFLSSSSFHQASNGEAFLVDNNGEMLFCFNLADHLSFLAIDTRGDIEGAWNQLVKIETKLGQNVSYAFSQKFGFTTSNPGKCGTAMTVSIFLQLSGLIHSDRLKESLDELADDSVMITGIQGNPTEILGDILVLQNNYSLGVTEENILSWLRTLSSKLIVEEKAARKDIAKSKNPAIMDKVSRAFAILLHSYQMEAIEALNAISLLKFGIDVGWISGITADALNQLFFNCRRAHLQSQFKDKINQMEIPHKRAEFIHQSLKNAKLLV
ncbi:MAG: protein arginine kinase [Parachlamydiaceae bacterium]|nr:protein arginine kinase [Parachlamydiaceae bacterium]